MDGASAGTNQLQSTCEACGSANAAGALFCARCTAPLAVPGLHELDERDLSLCRSALFKVLAGLTGRDNDLPSAETPNDPLWRAYLSAFWLRPETALILYAEAMAVRSLGKRAQKPWLDLGCGDGIHAALMAGWEFDAEFDAFQSLDLTAKDIYHHWDESHFRVGVKRAGRPIDHGLDIKPTAIARAKALGVFTHVQCADARELLLPDRSVNTIYSNMLRDLGAPLPAALRECRRVLTSDGVLLLSAMTPDYAGNLYFVNAARAASAAGDADLAARLLRLDRGRSVFCQRQLTIDQWRELLGEAGLTVADVLPIVSPAVIQFWDIGLRPFSLPLLRQRQAWAEAGTLTAIKPAVVDLIWAQLATLVGRLNSGPVHCMNILVVTRA